MKSLSPGYTNPNIQIKPPLYNPSPCQIRRIKTPTEFSKPFSMLLSPSKSNSKNTIKNNNDSFKDKNDKSQNSLKETEEVIQNLEEKLNRNLKENFELYQTFNEKSRLFEEQTKANLTLRSRIKELEGVLSLYTDEKISFEMMLKEKDEEIDELKQKAFEIKEQNMKTHYFELQIENYEEMFFEFQNLISEKNKEISLLKKARNSIKNPKIEEISKILNKITNKTIIPQNDIEFFDSFEKELLIIEETMNNDKLEIENLRNKNKELTEIINKGKNQGLQEIQLKQLREIDKKNKNEIEKLFGLINSRKQENDRIIEENIQIKEKYNISLQKLKNLENFFAQNFKTSS